LDDLFCLTVAPILSVMVSNKSVSELSKRLTYNAKNYLQ